jgi:hypothetical protein
MASELEGQMIAFVVANEGVEQVELTEPIFPCSAARCWSSSALV